MVAMIGDALPYGGPDCATNPTFCHASAVHVPYCTGDTHRGNHTDSVGGCDGAVNRCLLDVAELLLGDVLVQPLGRGPAWAHAASLAQGLGERTMPPKPSFLPYPQMDLISSRIYLPAPTVCHRNAPSVGLF